jgi:RNA polymerase sigma factor (TIGR02999 family)
VRQGGAQAAKELLPLVYEVLRRLAAHKMARESPGQTLQPTALVHEAWLRLAGPGAGGWENRGHFFAAAAEAMRRILVERARRRLAAKRGGGAVRLEAARALGIAVPTAKLWWTYARAWLRIEIARQREILPASTSP